MTAWILLIVFFLLDLFVAITRAAMLNARLPQLIDQGTEDKEQLERTIRILEKNRLRATLRFLVGLLHALVLACAWILVERSIVEISFSGMLGIFALILVILYRMIHSNLGMNFRAVQNDETAAAAVGVKVLQMRVLAFTVASAMAGFAGALYGHYLLLITPEIPSLDLQFYVLAMTVIGGMGSFIGPVVGAFALNILAEKIRDYGEYHVLVYFPGGGIIGARQFRHLFLSRRIARHGNRRLAGFSAISRRYSGSLS